MRACVHVCTCVRVCAYVCMCGDQSLTVRVWTDLDTEPTDESFGIDNVVIQGMIEFAWEARMDGNVTLLCEWKCLTLFGGLRKVLMGNGF